MRTFVTPLYRYNAAPECSEVGWTVNPQDCVDPSVDRGQPLTNPAIPNPALLTALAAGPRRESPSAFSVEWQLPLPTRDLIVREDNGDVVVDVGDMTRGAGADLEVFVDASPSA